jgi:amino acid transporter
MADTPTRTAPLARSMKLLGALFLTLSAATPASSVFVIVPDVLTQAGTGALFSMGIAALIAICVAQVYAELGSAFPFSGGEYAIVGRTLGPLSGFIVLGLNLTNSLLATGVLALGVAEYLSAAIPGLQPVPVALAVIVASTLLGILNIRTNALVTGVFVLVEIAALAVLAVLGFMHPARGLPSLLAHPQVLSGGTLHPAPLASIGLAVAVAIFAYDGYGSAVYFGEEMHEAPRRISRAILATLVIVVLAEVIPLVAVFTSAPDLTHLLGAHSIIGDFVTERGGPELARMLGVGVALAIVNAVIALVLLTSRQLYSTGRDETWGGPASRLLASVHPRFGSPWAATLVTGVLACSLCLIPLKVLLIATGTGVAVIYAGLCIAVLMGRRNGTSSHAPFRMMGFPLAPVLALIALVGVIWSDWIDPAEGRPGLLAAVGVAVVSAAYYLIVLRRRGWVLRAPEDEAIH